MIHAIASLSLLLLLISGSGCMASHHDQLMQLTSLKCRLPHMSNSALAAILAELKRTGLPDLAGTRWELKRARESPGELSRLLWELVNFEQPAEDDDNIDCS